LSLLPLAVWVVWVSVYLMETPCLMGDVSPNSSPLLMPLATALQPIVLPHGPHYVVLVPLSFLCVITTFVSILAHPIKASQTYELIVPSMHVESMSCSPL
jgi:hypothetical protein